MRCKKNCRAKLIQRKFPRGAAPLKARLGIWKIDADMVRMKRLMISALLLGCSVATQAAAVNVSAPISLRAALSGVHDAFVAVNPSAEIVLNFGASGALQQQIENGAPVHLFVSAATEPMDALAKKELLEPGTRRDILTNTLVLVAPAGSIGPESFETLGEADMRMVAIGEPKSVPVGKYATEVFAYFKLTEVLRERIVYAKDARQVLTYVETRDADAGVVYGTDALASAKVRVVAQAPAGSHSAIRYPAALIRGSANRKAARDFLEFLSSAEARAIFTKAGFGFPEDR